MLITLTSLIRTLMFDSILAATRENLSSAVCEQQRRRPACASAQSDQRLFIRVLDSIIFRLAMSEISIF